MQRAPFRTKRAGAPDFLFTSVLACSIFVRVSRFTEEQLISKALAAIEAVELRARQGPVEPTPELRFVLAFLANRAPERWPFDQCWQLVTGKPLSDTLAADFGRAQGLLAAVNGIYVQLGLRRPQ
jgi:hypothetical protein